MKITKILISLTVAVLIGLISFTAYAGEEFFEVGKSYLFVPRTDIVMKGTVTQVTDHEIVFTDRYILKTSKVAANMNHSGSKSLTIKSAAIAEYLKSKNKQSLLEASALQNVPTSYSRSEMTAVKIES